MVIRDGHYFVETSDPVALAALNADADFTETRHGAGAIRSADGGAG